MIFADGLVLGEWDQRGKGYVAYIGGVGVVCGNWKYLQNFVGKLSEEHLFTTSRRLIFGKKGERL